MKLFENILQNNIIFGNLFQEKTFLFEKCCL